MGFPGGTSGKKNNPAANAGETRAMDLYLRQEDPLERARQCSPPFLPGESRGQRSLGGYSLECHAEWNTTEAT